MSMWFSRKLTRFVLLGALYLAAAILSSQISFSAGNFPTLWLPGGLLLGVLLFSPSSDWPGYLLASLAGNIAYSLVFRQPVGLASITYLSNCLESATGAWLLLRLNGLALERSGGQVGAGPGRRVGFSTPRDTLLLIVIVGPLSAILSASIQTAVLVSTTPGISDWAAFRIAWIGHMLGILTVTPLLVAWKGYRTSVRSLLANPERVIETAGLYFGLATWAYYVFSGNALFLGRGYLVMPFLIWAALRFGPRGTSMSGLIVAIAATWGLVWQLDNFMISIGTIAPNTDILGIFLAINLITCYFLTTSLEEGKLTAAELRRSEVRYRRLIEFQGEGIGIVDLNEIFTFSNPAGNQIFGVDPGGLVGRNLSDFTSPQQFSQILQQTQARRNLEKTSYEIEITQPGGQHRQLLITATPEFDEDGRVNGSFAIFRDITDRKQAERALRDSQARFQALFDHSPIPIWEEDFSLIKAHLDELRKQGVEDFRLHFETYPDELGYCEGLLRVLNVNQAATQLCNYADQERFMEQIKTTLWRGPDDVIREELIAISEGKCEFDYEGPNDLINGVIRHHHVRWSVAPGFQHDYSRVIVSIIDITERKQTEEKLRYLSTHDVLTGLYNRNFFEAEMERLQQGRQFPINLMVVDVNGMKVANDTYGHATGDELLKRTAQVLRAAFRKEDIIARIGGDEFVVLFTSSLPEKEAVRRLRDCIEEHNLWADGPTLSLAIGAASANRSQLLEDVFKKADQLMYREKIRSRRGKLD